jgi:hypothetical protein
MDGLEKYVPHALVTALGILATGAGWVFKKHDERDDARFKWVGEEMKSINESLGTAIQKQSDNHAEILKILLELKK